MTIKVAINGFGRIGRNVARALFESGQHHEIQLVAINDLGSIETNAHLFRYDSVHGRFPGDVSVENDQLVINGQAINVYAERNPAELPWGDLDVDRMIS